MKVKHNIIKSLFAIAMMLIVMGCNDDDRNLTLPSHSIVESSHQYAGNAVQVNQEISFADVSHGVVSRTWSLPDGVAATILKLDKDVSNREAIRQALSNRDNLTEEEIENLESQLRIGDETLLPSFDEPILKLSFPEAGIYELTVIQEFEENPFIRNEIEPTDSNIVETVFIITVSDPIRFTNVQGTFLNSDGSLGETFNVTNNALAQVEAGQTVRYTFDVSGAVDEININADGGIIVPGSLVNNPELGNGMVDIKYNGLSNYDLTLTAYKIEPDSDRSITFTNAITVVPSSAPFILTGAIIEQMDERISIPFNGEFASIAGDVSTNFTVKLFDQANTFVKNLNIATITNNADNLTLLDITLSEPIYSTDNIKVSYDGNASLESTDTRTPEAFTDQPVAMYAPNLANNNIADGVTTNWTIVDPNGAYEISTEQAFTGDTSIKITKNGESGNFRIRTPFGATVSIDLNKQYVTRARVYIDPTVATPGGLKIHFLGSAPWWGINQNLSNINKGEWVMLERIIPFPKNSYTNFDIRVDSTSDTIIYIDDIYIGEYEVRP